MSLAQQAGGAKAAEAAKRMGRLVNRTAVREFALVYAREIGRGPVVTAIGASVYADLERIVVHRLRRLVETHPSGFRTLEAR
ncbi:MAG TPA: hypothetical protein VMZ50_06945 [Phycisphaerae bacterium]|nr:hypothetical protein [Phycisphaerae bacterium]HUX16878.1 hypothetical protein [Phycisphaerae bacterium]